MKICWEEKAQLEYLHWQTQDKKTLKKINSLLKDIDKNGYNCIGKPEPLKGELSGWWSVRIDEKIVWSLKSKMKLLRFSNVKLITATTKKLSLRYDVGIFLCYKNLDN